MPSIINTKKGETQDLTLMNIFITVFAATVILTITISIYDFNKTTKYEKELLATRLTLTTDALLVGDDNIKIKYLPQMFENKFKYRIQDNLVEVYDEQGQGKYSFLKKTATKIITQINNKPTESFNIIKNGNDLIFTEQEITPMKTSCPETQGIKSIILDIGKGYNPDYPEISNKGIQKNSLTESIILTQIAKALTTRMQNYYPIELTRNYEIVTKNGETYEDVISPEKRKQKIKESPNEFLISIHLGEFKTNTIKAYINAEQEKYQQNYAIACEIINELTQDLSQNKISSAIIPIIIQQQKKDFQILEQKPGVLIEIGNIELFANTNNIQQTANSIFEGLQH